MSDSKTVKKIEVMRCPIHATKTFWVMDGKKILWPPLNFDEPCCGTEAEAQEKAQQLANEEANKRQDELNAHFALTPAAQPTETRPPRYDAEEHRRILQSPLYAQLSEWRYIFDFLHDQQITPKKAIEALAELSIGLKPSLPARAAAPVEPPPKLSCTCASKGGYDPDCPVYAGKIPDPQAATELVEPAPRPPQTRQRCTCLGTCRGKKGLGEGWYCAIDTPESCSIPEMRVGLERARQMGFTPHSAASEVCIHGVTDWRSEDVNTPEKTELTTDQAYRICNDAGLSMDFFGGIERFRVIASRIIEALASGEKSHG